MKPLAGFEFTPCSTLLSRLGSPFRPSRKQREHGFVGVTSEGGMQSAGGLFFFAGSVGTLTGLMFNERRFMLMFREFRSDAGLCRWRGE